MTALLALAAGLVYAIAGLVSHIAVALVVVATSVFDSPVVLDTVSWGLIAGVVTPWLTSIVQQPRWSNRTRAWVGAGISVVIGILTCLVNGDLHAQEGQTVLATVAAVLVASQAAYSQLWKPTGVSPAIESATSPKLNRAA
jgi:hypothetical protein